MAICADTQQINFQRNTTPLRFPAESGHVMAIKLILAGKIHQIRVGNVGKQACLYSRDHLVTISDQNLLRIGCAATVIIADLITDKMLPQQHIFHGRVPESFHQFVKIGGIVLHLKT